MSVTPKEPDPRRTDSPKYGERMLGAARELSCYPAHLVAFQEESNRIEGINFVRAAEVVALERLLKSERLWTDDLISYVATVQPNAIIRDKASVPGVRVGNHIAPPSGPKLMTDLCMLLDRVNGVGAVSAWEAHVEYERLHVFTDGNGRSGRALWLWMHRGNAPLGFLHTWYYETLANLQNRAR